MGDDAREMPSDGYRMIWKGAAIHAERSGRVQVNMFYAWATTAEKAREMAERVYPKAKTIVIRKRGS
jgi:hypothetical protein